MATASAVGTVAEAAGKAAGKRLGGSRVSRPKAMLTSVVVGVGAAVVTYKLLRSGGDTPTAS